MYTLRYTICILIMLTARIQCNTTDVPGYPVFSHGDSEYTITWYINDTKVGHVTYRMASDHEVEIRLIEVDQKHQKQGIGKALLQRAVDHLEQDGAYVVYLRSVPDAKGFL